MAENCQLVMNLLAIRHILPPDEVVPPRPKLQAEQWNQVGTKLEVMEPDTIAVDY